MRRILHNSVLVLALCAPLASGCSGDAPSPVSPTDKTRLIAGNYAAELIGRLPSNCALSLALPLFDLKIHAAQPLIQHDGDVTFDATDPPLNAVHLTGEIAGDQLTYQLQWDDFDPASGRTTVTGAGSANIRDGLLFGPFSGRITSVGQQVDPVTTQCNVDGLVLRLSQGDLPRSGL